MAEHGGARANAGRKPKADEERVRRLGLDAIKDVYGSVEDYYKHIAKESKDSFPHLKLLQEYVFGKPKETHVIEDGNEDSFDYSTLSDKALEEIASLKFNKSKQS